MSASARAFAPASIGNLGVGFDVLGLAIAGVGDEVTATRCTTPGITIAGIEGDAIAHDAAQLSTRADANTASIAVAALWQAQGETDGLTLHLRKGTPLGSGMGSSAASAVAGVVAANALLQSPLPVAELLPYALDGEAFASKARHADNVAPSLFGGLVLCPSVLLPATESVPTPDDVVSVLVHPHLRVNTADARNALSESIALTTAVTQMGLLAGFVQACYRQDKALMKATLRDVMIEPQRARFVQGFDAVKSAALGAGAYGCSLSGSGPSLFALCDAADAEDIAQAMVRAFADNDIDSNYWISAMNAPGAGVVART